MRTSAILIALSIGCGDDTMSAPIDATGGDRMFDATPPDASPDATTPDAGRTFSGLVLIAGFQIENEDALGNGGVIQIRFNENGTGPVPQMHVSTVQGTIGCTGDLFNAADVAGEGEGLDEGTIQITGATATIPPCRFVAGAGYLCIGQAGQGSLVNVAPGSMGTATVAVANATFTSADVGRYLDIRGDATNSSNNGRFPIVQRVSATALVIENPAARTSTFPGSFATVAGAGPVPTSPAGFLEASDDVTVTLTPGARMDFPAFSQSGIHGVAPFSLTTASQGIIRTIPTSGSAVTLDCDDQNGNVCDGTLTILSMETTDGSTSGLPNYIMPAPVNKVARINCTFISHSANVPASVMQMVMAAAPTRIATVFARVNFAQTAGAEQSTFVLGRAIAGYTTP